MHFPITFSILIICASLQINAKPIDTPTLTELVQKSKDLKDNFAQILQNEMTKVDVESDEYKLINAMSELSAKTEEIISTKMKTNPQPIDYNELTDLLGRNEQIKRDVAKYAKEKVKNGKVTPEDTQLIRTTFVLSATVRRVIAFLMESQLDTLDTTTKPTAPTTTASPTTPSTTASSTTPTTTASPTTASTTASSTTPTTTASPTTASTTASSTTPTTTASPTTLSTTASSTNPTSTTTPPIKDADSFLDDFFGS